MAKEKKSNKGRFGKTKQTAEEKKRAMSHKDQKTQKWKAERMDEAFRLWEENKDLPPDKQLSMRAIAEKVGIGKNHSNRETVRKAEGAWTHHRRGMKVPNFDER